MLERKKCWQRLMRDNKMKNEKDEWWKDLTLTSKNAEVKVVDYNTAKSLILEYEWLMSMPSGAFLCVGLFFDGHMAGVEVFTEIKAGGKYTLLHHPATLLARGCCVHWSPNWGSSFLIAKSLKFLEEYYKGEPRYVIAFSDWDAGEIGTVYQACSWTYLGFRDYYGWLSPDGKRYDARHHANIALRRSKEEFKQTKKVDPELVQSIKKELLEGGWKIIKTTRGKYATVIGHNSKSKKELIKKIEKESIPYPKVHVKMKEHRSKDTR